jgi:hypothetical protein
MSWLQEMVHSNCGLEMFYVHIIAQYNGLVASFLNIPYYWIPFAPTLLSFVLFQLGANAILSVSLAVCKAGAGVKKIPLYQVGSLTPCSPVLLVLLICCCMGCAGFDTQLL